MSTQTIARGQINAKRSTENTADTFGVTPVNKVKRVHDRGRYDRKTVYEILNAFVREGLAACVTDGGEPFRYESMTAPHYHARCRVCGRIFDLPARANSQIRGLAELPEGFDVESIGVTLRGVCLRCRDDV